VSVEVRLKDPSPPPITYEDGKDPPNENDGVHIELPNRPSEEIEFCGTCFGMDVYNVRPRLSKKEK